jgi:heptosyltransferase-3
MRVLDTDTNAALEQRSPRILVIRLRRLGDTLLVTPTLRAIRQTHPSCLLDMVVSSGFHHALVGNPRLDRLYVAGGGLRSWLAFRRACRQRRYDVVLDLQSSSRSIWFTFASRAPMRVGWRKQWVRDRFYTTLVRGWNDAVYGPRKSLRFAQAIGVPVPADVRPELGLTDADRACARRLFAESHLTSDKPVIALSVVATDSDKQWPAAHYAALADRLIESDQAQIVLTHGPGEIEQVRAVVNRMRERPALWDYPDTTVTELGAIFERCDLWIGNDGGPKHVATAVACPTLTIIRTGEEPYWTNPDDPKETVISATAAEGVRLDALSVERVYALARASLASWRRSPAGASECDVPARWRA